MVINNPIELTLYVAGNNEEDASDCIPFDDFYQAGGFADDNNFAHVYAVTAYLDLSTMQVIDPEELED